MWKFGKTVIIGPDLVDFCLFTLAESWLIKRQKLLFLASLNKTNTTSNEENKAAKVLPDWKLERKGNFDIRFTTYKNTIDID